MATSKKRALCNWRCGTAVLSVSVITGLSACSGTAVDRIETGSISRPVVELAPYSSLVVVAPVLGAPPATAEKITTFLNRQAEGQQVAVLREMRSGASSLHGYLSISETKGTIKLTYVWDFLDRNGGQIVRLADTLTIKRVTPGSAWDAVSDSYWTEMVNKIVAAIKKNEGHSLETKMGAATNQRL